MCAMPVTEGEKDWPEQDWPHMVRPTTKTAVLRHCRANAAVSTSFSSVFWSNLILPPDHPETSPHVLSEIEGRPRPRSRDSEVAQYVRNSFHGNSQGRPRISLRLRRNNIEV